LKQAKIDINLNSNLTIITPEIAIALQESGLKTILTTVLSYNENIHDFLSGRKGVWKQTIKGIDVAMTNGLQIGVNMVLLKQNHKSLYKTAEFVKSLGIYFFSATKASPSLNSRNFDKFRLNIKELRASLETLEIVKKNLDMNVDILECYPLCLLSDLDRFWHYGRRNCTAGVTTCTIGFNGNIRPCSHSDMLYGNIFKESLIKIFSKMSKWVKGEYVPNDCKNCSYLRMCSGGCRMEAKYLGNICGKDPYMTDPNDIIPRSTEIISDISINQKYLFKANFRWRKEEFGAIVSVEGADTLLVNLDGLAILQQLPNYPFSVVDIAKKTNSKPEDLKDFFSHILHRRFIYPSKG
jgi:radical SAM protein with 4Fe4S-binding SPASM domain